MSVASPINLILASLFVVLLYWHFRPKQPIVLPRGPPPVVFRTYTPKTLIEFNGENDKPVYLAVRGRVFDVTPGRNFYGPVGELGSHSGHPRRNSRDTELMLGRVVLTRTLLGVMRRVAWPTRALMRRC